ncbi:alanine--tRNA ligase [Helicobacter didelphidarum]|uniref:Alanine--tRNA ligase n=1 Tax=Helicobacter didelphidarum TaxID=2040648 RepID=A0A3D8IRF5_9HELI|nr:alanine--tRNA ligase [Helicobacter didelphidarum]RDU67560.1 alanine--tRNA ligase [Helicobacter didelphidarum]
MDIRALYLDYFKSKNHLPYSSMPLVPDDASLLFTNAGMVQFKDIFTGKIPIPTPPRATSSQLCIRAGGKHNDLENVGYTARHHTLFEMLGNFSFGDYFKKEAIAYAWEFVTQVLGFDKSVLYVTIHESDDEAYELWCEHIESSRIKRMGDKDNFWQMGDSGPCGPCSEIYIDQGEQYFHSSEDYFGGEGDRFLEIWNLVFMQYEQKDGIRTPLPKPSIDTGMGLERVIALKEGKINNFDTSLFAPLMKCIENLTGQRYYGDDEKEKRIGTKRVEIVDSMENTNHSMSVMELSGDEVVASFRVIADHARSVAFLLAQGVNFDKEGRGYVLRRILRRAVRHGYLLGLKKAFLYEVVGVVCDSMGTHYEYLKERKKAIQEQCKNEEERFFETIESGMNLFSTELEKIIESQKTTKADCASQDDERATQPLDSHTKYFDGEIAFKLYDTYGFPLDLTQDMLREYGLEVDMEGFEVCMNAQKARSKASWKGSGDSAKEGDFKEILAEFGENEFVGYECMSAECAILALLDSDFKRVESLKAGSEGYVLLDRTPFYPESGGPIGDRGALYLPLDSDSKKRESKVLHSHSSHHRDDCKNNANQVAQVLDTKKYFGLNLSQIKALTPLKMQQKVFAQVDCNRLEIIKHHSATHLLHYALRKVLGTHIAQAGSLVEASRLRFDFSHPKALSDEEIESIEALVNTQIRSANSQICENMSLNAAKQKGAMALFGEKYGENVRVISFGDSIELCGGIHVRNSAEIGSFYITKESGVSSGVRRIEAVCGVAAYAYGKNALEMIKRAKEELKTQDLTQGIQKLKNEFKELKEKANKARSSVKSFGYEMIGGVKLIIASVDIESSEAKELVDRAKNESQNVAIMLITTQNDKATIIAGVKADSQHSSKLKAGAWVKIVSQSLGGNGGGRDDFATAGGKLPSDETQAKAMIKQGLEKARAYAKSALGD